MKLPSPDAVIRMFRAYTPQDEQEELESIIANAAKLPDDPFGESQDGESQDLTEHQ